MPRKIYNKLIRDKVPEVITAHGSKAQVSVLSDETYKIELKKKLLEEGKELLEAKDRVELLGELADVSELLEVITAVEGFTFEEVKERQQAKREERGSFDKKLFLEHVDEV